MDLADLAVFKAVVDEGGIGAAAQRLRRVQSGVTVRIQRLEASLGTQLFVREKRRLFLSPAGELFLQYAERLLDLSAQARAAVAGDAPRGVLRIGALESTAASRLPPLLARYHERHPGVRVELSTGTTDALVARVLARGIEAAFVADRPAHPALDAAPAFREELVVIAPASHPRVRSARDVRADAIIAFPQGCAYRRRLQAWLADGGIAPEHVLELGSYHAIVACVASGTGIAVAPRAVLRTLRGAANVATYPLPPKEGRTVTSLIWRKGEPSRALRALQAEVPRLRLT